MQSSSEYLFDKDTKLLDTEIAKHYPDPNYAEIFYGWQFRKSKIKAIAKEHYSTKVDQIFYEAVRTEHGIETPQNLEKALELYQTSAQKHKNPLALYRLYKMHQTGSFSKFSLKERDRDLEMFYLIQSFSYMLPSAYVASESMFSINLAHEFAFHLDIADKNLTKTKHLLDSIVPSDLDKFKVTRNELTYIRAMFTVKFHMNDDIAKGLATIEALAKEGCTYSKGFVAYINHTDNILVSENKRSQEKARTIYSELVNDGIYRFLHEEALMYFNLGQIDKCKEVLEKGISHGIDKCFFYLFDIMCIQMTELIVKGSEKLFRMLVIDLINGGIYPIFEILYYKRILMRDYNYKISDEYDFEQELAELLQEREQGKFKWYIHENDRDCKAEFNFSLGYYKYSHASDLPSFKSSLVHFQRAYTESENSSYQRFCYSYIWKSTKRLADLGDDQSKEELPQIEARLFHQFHEAVKKIHLEYLSSSFFYFYAQLYESGVGVTKNDIMAFSFYQYGLKASRHFLGNGSIISYYRKFKIDGILNNNIKYKGLIKEINDLKESKEKELCDICYENPKSVIFYPCKHYVCCDRCSSKVIYTKQCPICRAEIILYR